MFCKYCGYKLVDGSKFCGGCGKAITYEAEAVPNSKSPILKRRIFNRKHIKALILFLCIIGIVLGSVVVIKENTLEKRLMRYTWWSEIHVDYDAKYGHVQAFAQAMTFCPNQNVRWEDFNFGSGAYQSSYEVTADNLPSYYKFSNAESYNHHSWEILDDNRLRYTMDINEYYEWDKEESEDTWYLKGDTLRIGTMYYTNKKPNINITALEIPYWCANCGEEGPFKQKECPECESKKRVKCEW